MGCIAYTAIGLERIDVDDCKIHVEVQNGCTSVGCTNRWCVRIQYLHAQSEVVQAGIKNARSEESRRLVDFG